MILLGSLVIIIILHEAGHLLAAKLFKCGVKTFSIGFGPKLWGFKFGKTYYQIAPILLGGYCELEKELTYSRSKYAFTNKTYTQKVIISLAGIGMNCWSAFIAYWLWYFTYNPVFLIFGVYSLMIGLSNLLPIPALDGGYPIAFLFEKKLGKKKFYSVISSIFEKWFFWLMVLNVVSLPYLGWLIWKGYVL
jgi:membrane-associated protease RseP (regulator of RpoE activity)